MGAKYIYRIDDITPEMNWTEFWRYINLFQAYNVKPVLGIVPYNQDPNLRLEEENKKFWEIMRELQQKGVIDIAQHGYQHKLYHTSAPHCLEIKKALKHFTEFVGLPYKEQYDKIKKGQEILMKNGIDTDIWMAPCHSLDFVTLRALKDLGFHFITDGIAVYPFLLNDLIFVPQQFGKPRWAPFGIFTICIHLNDHTEEIFKKVKKHIKSGSQIISFYEAVASFGKRSHVILNGFFKITYKIVRNARLFTMVIPK